MFHVLLVLPILAPFLALYGAVAAVLLGAPFWVGVTLQVIVTAVTEKRFPLCLPAVLGGVCAVGYFFLFRGVIPLWFQGIYWAVFYLCLWLAWLVVDKLRAAVLRWLGRR